MLKIYYYNIDNILHSDLMSEITRSRFPSSKVYIDREPTTLYSRF